MELQRFRQWSTLVRFWEDTAKTIPLDVSARVFTAEMKVGAMTISIHIITVDAALGEITLYLTDEETGTLPWNASTGKWDLCEDVLGVLTTAIPTQTIKITTPVTVP